MANQIQVRRGPLASLPATANDGEPLWVNDSGNEAFYMGRGALLAPFLISAGGGNVAKSGAPANNQVAVWVSDGIIEGTANFTFDDTTVTFFVGDSGGTNWVSTTHDTTDGTIATGAGNLVLNPAGVVKADKNLKLGNTLQLVFDTDDDTYLSASADDVLEVNVGAGGNVTQWTPTLAQVFTDLALDSGNPTFYLGTAGNPQGSIVGSTTLGQALFGVGLSYGRQLVLTDEANTGSDHDHATQANPTLFIHSATDPDTDNDEWLSISHDGGAAHFETGFGNFDFQTIGSVRFLNSGGSDRVTINANSPTLIEVAAANSFIQLVNAHVGIYWSTGTDAYLASATNTLQMTTFANGNNDHDHPAQANPTFFIHSATDPNANNTQWISFTHDQTDGLIETGSGDINLKPAIATNFLTTADAIALAINNNANELLILNGVSKYLQFTNNFQGIFWADANSNNYLTSAANGILFTAFANRNQDHDHGVSTNPTIFVHSATNPDTDNTQWLSLSHDQTEAIIEAGSGGINLTSGDAEFVVSSPAAGFTRVDFNGTAQITRGTADAIFIGSNGLYINPASHGGDVSIGSGFSADNLKFRPDLAADQLTMSIDVGLGRQIVICDQILSDRDYDHAVQTNPTLFIHSAVDPDVDNTQWISLSHDQTDASLDIGDGSGLNINFENQTGNIKWSHTGTAVSLEAVSTEWRFITQTGATLFGTQGTGSSGFSNIPMSFLGDLILGATSTGSVFNSSTHVTDGSLNLGLRGATGSNFALVLTTVANYQKNHDHGLQSTPTLFVHSDTDPDLNNTQWISMTHDQTDGILAVGTGSVKFGSNAKTGLSQRLIVDDDDDTYFQGIADDVAGIFVAGSEVARFDSQGIKPISATIGEGSNSGAVNFGGLTSTDTRMFFDLTKAQFLWGTGDDHGNQVVIGNAAFITRDFDHATTTNPTLFIHSDTDPDTDNTEWISISHDTTSGVIDSGDDLTFSTTGTARMTISGSTTTTLGTHVVSNSTETLSLAHDMTDVTMTASTGSFNMITTEGALIVPRLTTTQRDALTAVNGMILYNTTTNKFQGYENGAWTNLI